MSAQLVCVFAVDSVEKGKKTTYFPMSRGSRGIPTSLRIRWTSEVILATLSGVLQIIIVIIIIVVVVVVIIMIITMIIIINK